MNNMETTNKISTFCKKCREIICECDKEVNKSAEEILSKHTGESGIYLTKGMIRGSDALDAMHEFSAQENARLKEENEKLKSSSMRWIPVEEMHFVDIIKNDKTGYEYVQNNNCPNEPFLVAIETNKGFDIERVILGEYGLEVVSEDDTQAYDSWNPCDVTHWMKISIPHTKEITTYEKERN